MREAHIIHSDVLHEWVIWDWVSYRLLFNRHVLHECKANAGTKQPFLPQRLGVHHVENWQMLAPLFQPFSNRALSKYTIFSPSSSKYKLNFNWIGNFGVGKKLFSLTFSKNTYHRSNCINALAIAYRSWSMIWDGSRNISNRLRAEMSIDFINVVEKVRLIRAEELNSPKSVELRKTPTANAAAISFL